MGKDIVVNFDLKRPLTTPNRYCKTLRRTVKEVSDRHNLVFKGIVNRFKPNEASTLPTFVIVADKIFEDGQVNWGRIVAVYAFATHLVKHYEDTNRHKATESRTENLTHFQDKIGSFVGKYVAYKLGQWILYHGGWDSFVEYFPEHDEFEKRMWKGVLFTTIGFVTLATVVGYG